MRKSETNSPKSQSEILEAAKRKSRKDWNTLNIIDESWMLMAMAVSSNDWTVLDGPQRAGFVDTFRLLIEPYYNQLDSGAHNDSLTRKLEL